LNVTGIELADAQLVEDVVVEVAVDVVEVGLGDEPLPPTIAISAQCRYTWAVWNEFHLNRRRVWLDE
jgi:hypothetical protein